MTIDAHHHVWDLSVRPQPWLDQPELAPLRRNFLISDLEPEAAAHGVTTTVVVQTVTGPEETPELLALAEASDLVAGVVGWVNLEASGAQDAIAALRELPGGGRLVGIRHPVLIEPDPDWLARPAVLRALAAVAAAGLCYDVVVMPGQLRGAVVAAASTPQLTFVLDHLGNPEIERGVDEGWARAIADFAALPNTVAKLSGILGEPAPPSADAAAAGADGAQIAHLRPHYEIVLAAFGPRRLMFASDWPVSTMSVGYDGVYAAARSLTADLSPSEQDAIFTGTARSTYRLGATPRPL